MNSMPVPSPTNVSAVSQSPTGTSDQQILQAEQRLNQLVSQFNSLVAQIQLFSRDFIQLRAAAVTSVIGTANQVAVARSGSVETVSLTTNVAIAGNFKAGGYVESDAAGLYLDAAHDAGIALDGSGNTQIGVQSGKIVYSNNAFQAPSITLTSGGGGNYYAVSGDGGVSGSFGSPVACVFENGLLTAGDPTSGGGGGSGVPDVPFDSGTHVMYVRQSVTTPGPGGNWESLDTYFSGIAPSTKWPGSSDLTTLGTIATGVWGSGATTIAIASGGTGQTTADDAFAALAPTTTKGDIIYCSDTTGPVNDNLGIGTTGQALIVASGLPAWGTLGIAGGGTDLTTTPSNGDLLIGNGTNYTLTTITGTSNQVVVNNGSGSITLSLPQSINTGATVQFAKLGLGTSPTEILHVSSTSSNHLGLTNGSNTWVAYVGAGGNLNFSGPGGGVVAFSALDVTTNATISGNLTVVGNIVCEANLVNGGSGAMRFDSSDNCYPTHLILPTS